MNPGRTAPFVVNRKSIVAEVSALPPSCTGPRLKNGFADALVKTDAPTGVAACPDTGKCSVTLVEALARPFPLTGSLDITKQVSVPVCEMIVDAPDSGVSVRVHELLVTTPSASRQSG